MSRTLSCYWFALLLATLIPPAAAEDALSAKLAVEPFRSYEMVASVSPKEIESYFTSIRFYPGFIPEFLLEIDGAIVDRNVPSIDGSVRFNIPARSIGYRNEVTARLIPSMMTSLDGKPLNLTMTVTSLSPTRQPNANYKIDIGHPGDLPFIGEGFSYQEGKTFVDGSPWLSDQDFRWSRRDCEFRLPMIPGNSHRITLNGRVTVGFVVQSGDRILAKFERPNAEDRYTFDVDKSVTENDEWLRLRLGNLDPLPIPNLDLRELFWALESVGITTHGDGMQERWKRLAASSLEDAAFLAALPSSGPREVLLDAKARWDLPAGYKTSLQLEQEGLVALSHGGDPRVCDDWDMHDSAYVTEHLLAPLQTTLDQYRSLAGVGTKRSDVGILVTRQQLAATTVRPSNADPVLEPIRGAYRLTRRVPYLVNIVDDADPRRWSDIQLMLVPSAMFIPDSTWKALRRYVQDGGTLVVPASARLPILDAASSSSLVDLFGAKPVEFFRDAVFIPMSDEWLHAWYNDWRAKLAITTATMLKPMARLPSKDAIESSPIPFATINSYGKGRAILFAFDPFTDFAEYGNPQWERLFAEVLNAHIHKPQLEVHGGEHVSVSLRSSSRQEIVQLVNESRGHFDAASLVNAGRSFVFAEEVPRSPALTISIALESKPLGVHSVPHINDLAWEWKDGRLSVGIPSIELATYVVIDKEPIPQDQTPTTLDLPTERPLVRLDPSLEEQASLGNTLTTKWPIEVVDNKPFLWLGDGADEGLTFDLHTFRAMSLRLTAHITPGHGRTDRLRHISLLVTGKEVWAGTIDKMADLEIPLTLEPGVHRLTLQCLDHATVKDFPNNDKRNLLVALQSLKIDSNDR